MARLRHRVPLSVVLNGRLVGRLTKESSGAIEFRYDPGWLAWEHAIPVSLSLPLREDRYAGDPVHAVFDNLLPDSEPLRRALAGRVGARSADAFDLLAEIGRDCVGALQFLPESEPIPPAGTIRGTPMSETDIAVLIRDLGRAPLGLGEDVAFRISIAGAQEKTALLRLDGVWHKPLGTTPTTHILKPEIGRLPNGLDLSHSIENEHLCLSLMAELGLPVARTEIAEFESERVLVIERFDRLHTADGRLLRRPQEDCCQALSVPSSRKYDAEGGPGIVDILTLLQGSDDAEADQTLFLKAQIVFWLIGATDGHAKNFSLFLAPGGRYRLAPLYDVLSAEPSFADGQIRRRQMKLAMAVGKSRHYTLSEIQPRHYVETAKRAGVGEGVVKRVWEELLESVPGAFDRAADVLPSTTPSELPDTIRKTSERRLGQIGRALQG
ncbi:type II toxin-antitoxin system HipA family toxin [Acuticoccus sediminis]|uniref:type II toxin-antitoxin system HipA family toxin n=1 Tax=Acuticoccus sediminis TaxID=2184697 RepID=UPI001CFDA1AD|nr:type II toxin-antitoxin system HipA family toxin [Acuticoccus sediminis]